jgi:hypothetical protein
MRNRRLKVRHLSRYYRATSTLCICRYLNFLLRRTEGDGQDVPLRVVFLEQQAGHRGPLERWVAVVVDERYAAVVDVQILLTSVSVQKHGMCDEFDNVHCY